MAFKLRYFDGKGAAEPIRLLFATAGKMDLLEDVRYPADMSKYSQGIKVAAPEYGAAVDAGLHAANLNRAPVMEIEGVSVGQSAPIERLVARRVGLYGQTDIEGAQIDAIVEHLADIRKSYHEAKKKGEEDKAAWFKDALPEWMGKVENAGYGDGFAVGSGLTWADVRVWHFVNEYFDDVESVKASIAECPKILKSVEAVGNVDSVKEYLAQRKQTAFCICLPSFLFSIESSPCSQNCSSSCFPSWFALSRKSSLMIRLMRFYSSRTKP